MARMSRGWILVAIVLGGCFTEAGGVVGDECVERAVGCPCDASAACDAGLTCATEIGLCIPDGCAPGSELCTCQDGACLSGLMCEAGLCRAPSGSGDDNAGTVGSVSNSGSVTVDPSDTETTAHDDTTSATMTSNASLDTTATTSLDTTATTSLDTTITDPSDSDTSGKRDMGTTDSDTTSSGAECQACIVDSNGAGGACEMALTTCAGNMACVSLAGCVSDCVAADDGMCILACCDANALGIDDYSPLGSCNQQACGTECADFVLACGG